MSHRPTFAAEDFGTEHSRFARFASRPAEHEVRDRHDGERSVVFAFRCLPAFVEPIEPFHRRSAQFAQYEMFVEPKALKGDMRRVGIFSDAFGDLVVRAANEGIQESEDLFGDRRRRLVYSTTVRNER
jgi:hypothetical protein